MRLDLWFSNLGINLGGRQELQKVFEGLQAESLRGKGGEDVQGLESNFGKLLLVNFMRPHPTDLETFGIMMHLGS